MQSSGLLAILDVSIPVSEAYERAVMLWIKGWFNRRWPYYAVCMHPWCFRGQTYQYRCWRHQDD